MEWVRENAKLTTPQRDAAIEDLIALVGAVDGILQGQSSADTNYLASIAGRAFSSAEVEASRACVLKAYRWQYIVSGVQDSRFNEILGGMLDEGQGARVGVALAPLLS